VPNNNLIGFIETELIDEATSIANAITNAEAVSNEFTGTSVINLYYYIVAKTGRVIIAVNNEDKLLLSLPNNVIDNILIPEFNESVIELEYKDFSTIEIDDINLSSHIEKPLYIIEKIENSAKYFLLNYIYGKAGVIIDTNLYHTYQKDIFTILTPASGGSFGSSLYMSKTKVLAGTSRGYGDPGDNYIHIYDLDGTNRNVFATSLQAEGASIGAALNDNNKVVIAGFNRNDKDNIRTIQIYNIGANNELINELTIETSHPANSNDKNFGTFVSMNNNKIVVTDGYSKVYIYDIDGTNEKVINSIEGSEYFASYGRKCAISQDVIIVGSFEYDGRQGRVYVYDYSGKLLRIIESPDGGGFGMGVATNGNIIVATAYQAHGVSSSSGKAYIFDMLGNKIKDLSTLLPSPSQTGYDVTINDKYIIVGSGGGISAYHLDGSPAFFIEEAGRYGETLSSSTEGFVVGDDRYSKVYLYT